MDWNGRLASGTTHATLAESSGIRIDYLLPPCEMLVEGDVPSTRTDVYVDSPNGVRHLDERRLLEQHGIRITRFTLLDRTGPVSN